MGDKQDILIINQDQEQLKQQAADFLKSGYFFAAQQFYKKLLEEEPDNKDYHIASLMAKNSIRSEDELIVYYQDLYSKPEYEAKPVTETEDSHVEEAIEKSYIPGYLEEDEIRKAYDFDLTYQSCLACRQKQKEKIQKLIDEDEDLSWLKTRGFSEIGEIIRAYDDRIDQAESDERYNEEKTKNEYQRFLYQAYTKVKDLAKKARNQKDSDYRSLISQYEESDDKQELKDLIIRFESFNDYKQSKRYISLCEKKIEDLKKQDEDASLRKSIEEAIDSARNCLLKKNYGEAYDGFAKVVSLDPNSEEAYAGILMSQTKTTDLDELFEYYKNLYSEDKKESFEAIEEDLKHIDEMCEKYYLPEFLEKETIREKYLFERTYQSSLNNRVRQESQIVEETQANPIFVWLKEHGSRDIQNRINDLYDTYHQRTLKAEEEDELNTEKIKSEYQRHLFKVYAQIKKLYNDAVNQKEEEYKDIIRSYNTVSSEEDLNDLIDRLKVLEDYKDSERYITLCQNRIDEIREKENSLQLQQEIETTLIAGRSYLLAGNKDLAAKSFDKVLSLDENNPHAYLGILMIETGTRDYESLIRYYQNLYSEDLGEQLEGCQIDRDHIEKTADRYYLPGYFEKETIRRYYNFDRSYESFTTSRKEQKKQLEEEFSLNPLLTKIDKYKDSEVTKLIDQIYGAYDERIRQSKEADEKQCKSIEHIYGIYQETDRTIEKIYEEKLKERNEDLEVRYKENVSDFFVANEIEELEVLVRKLEADKEYKDNRDYLEKAKEKLKSLRYEKEKDRLEELYTQGDEFLEKKLFNQAKEKFISYLDIDPDNENAHLNLLMAETETTDIDQLFNYYKNLYHENSFETLEVEDEFRNHIEEIAEKCRIPDVLETDEIKEKYSFNRSYDSHLSFMVDEKKQIINELDLNPSLNWLKQNGSARVRDYISDLLRTYDIRIQDAQKEDQENRDFIAKEYRSFIRNKDREVRSLYNSLLKEKSQEKRRAEKEAREAAQRELKEVERDRKRKEEQIRAEYLSREQEKKKQAEARKEERRLAAQKEELEKQAQRNLEKEIAKQERREKAKKEIGPPKPNIGIVMAVISLMVFAVVCYRYLWIPMNQYKEALTLAEAGNYDEAATAFEQLGNYKDSAYQVKNAIYMKADSLYKQGDLIGAANIFAQVKFDDSEVRLKQIKDKLMAEAEVGSSVLFGAYEQDNDESNGKELVEWTVLAIDEGKMLLISRYGLDNQVYNAETKDASWRDSELRGWLNSIFLNNLADFNEKSQILSTVLYTYPYEYEYEEGDDLMQYETSDKVFVFDSADLDLYMPDYSGRLTKPTVYAVEKGALTDDDENCSWWLRSAGNDANMIEYVWNRDGTVASSMQEIRHALRPVVWLKKD